MSKCSVCGAALEERHRFCPECGARIEPDQDETLESALPPVEDEPGPVTVAEQPHWFGVTPSGTVLVLGVVALALAVVLFVLGDWILGIVIFALGWLLIAYFASLVRRRPDTPLAQASLNAVGGARARMGAAVDAVGTMSSGRRALLRLRYEQEELRSRRERLLRTLGEAVYLADHQATESARAELIEVDEALAAKETEMTTIANEMHDRVRAARDEVRETQLLEPQPPLVPEPAPPPDEGTPPTPAPIPEPYPPPDEGTPPVPDPLPELTAGTSGRPANLCTWGAP
jgi:hypothetical protein